MYLRHVCRAFISYHTCAIKCEVVFIDLCGFDLKKEMFFYRQRKIFSDNLAADFFVIQSDMNNLKWKTSLQLIK